METEGGRAQQEMCAIVPLEGQPTRGPRQSGRGSGESLLGQRGWERESWGQFRVDIKANTYSLSTYECQARGAKLSPMLSAALRS